MNANQTKPAALSASAVAPFVDARRSANCPYPFLLVYAQKFTAGTLEGIERTDSLPFCSEFDAGEWVRKINEKNTKGTMPYRVTDHAITAL